MAARGPGGQRYSVAAGVVVVAALGLMANLATSTVSVPAEWTLVAWCSVVALVVSAVVLELRGRRAPARPVGHGLDEAVSTLAVRVLGQWRQEASRRGLTRPVPLRVRWSSTGRPVAPERDAVMDDPGSTWQELPLQGDIDEIVAAFRSVPRRQLVVLGEPGAGKTALTVWLTVQLLRCRQPGEPVPVLLTVASWTPDVESAAQFVVRRIVEDYGPLGDGDDGGVTAEALLWQGRIAPIFDGLDEIDPVLHAKAIEALDELAGAGVALVVTCRSREYQRAVLSSGSMLSAAAVVELERVDLEQAIAYLSRSEVRQARWEPVFDQLRQRPDGLLARMLATPLMVSMAKIAYRDPGSDPRGLLEAQARGTASATLFDAFLAAAYEQAPGCRPNRDVRWLETLAYLLYRAGTRDLWWWQLDAGEVIWRPDRLRMVVRAVGAGLAAVAGLLFGVVTGGLVAGWAAAAAGVLIVVAAAVQPSWWWPGPAARRAHRQGRPGWPRRLRARLGADAALVAATGIMLVGAGAGRPAAVVLSLVGGVITAVLAGVPAGRSMPGVRRAATQRSMVSAVRRHTGLAALYHGLTAGGVFTAVALVVGLPTRTTFVAASIAALTYGLAAACGAGRSWIRYRVHHLLLALRGELPYRLLTFLDDAHNRHVARTAGPVWQFRHALLQDHLARHGRLRVTSRRASAGHSVAAWELAGLLRELGDVEELRRRADTGDRAAARGLAGLLCELGDVEELRRRADAGDWDAGRELAGLLRELGNAEELRRRADAGGWDAGRELAGLLRELGDVGELRRRARRRRRARCA